MIDKIFLDTNILVYMFDKSEKQKQELINKIITDHLPVSKFIISVQVVNEFVNVTSKKISNPIPIHKQNQIIDLLNELFFIVPLNLSTSYKAIEISGKYKLSYWDSLIISSALENNCNIIYSEDMQDGLMVEKLVTLRNPLTVNE
jgi:predicted nucleic acid-binding protein